MSHKFAIGQMVEYKPAGSAVGLFKVMGHMPTEFKAPDWRYRIKNTKEIFERNVLEYDLSPSLIPAEDYQPVKQVRRNGGHK